MIRIDVTNEQTTLDVDDARLRNAVELILSDAGVTSGMVSVAVVDDTAIHRLNREFLEHDYPTDVLSFLLDRKPAMIEGEVIVSGDTAQCSAAQFGWSPHDELLLYVIHGTLHLVGYDDLQPDLLAEMRRQEERYLAHFGLRPRY